MNQYFVRPSHEYDWTDIDVPAKEFLKDVAIDAGSYYLGGKLSSYLAKKAYEYGFDPRSLSVSAARYAARRGVYRAFDKYRPRRMTRGSRAYQRTSQTRVTFGRGRSSAARLSRGYGSRRRFNPFRYRRFTRRRRRFY